MLSLQFFYQNFHFGVSLFAALVCFAVFWLYLDAWTNQRQAKELFRWLGFLLLCLSFLAHATLIEQTVLGSSRLGDILDPLSLITRLAGYLLIIYGLIIDPLQARPHTEGIQAPLRDKQQTKPKTFRSFFAGGGKFTGLSIFKFALPVGSFAIGLLYLRRATTGLERHLRPVAIAFLCLGVFDLLSLSTLLRTSNNPLTYSLVAPFGPAWLIEHLLLLAAMLILGRWVWRYLTKRIQSQFFIIITSATMAIFLITTVSFTFLLLSSLQREALNNLTTAAKTLNYALDSKKAETGANAQIVAQNPAIAEAVASRDHSRLASLTSTFLVTKKQSTLIIVNDSAQVLLRGEDPSSWGDSLSDNTLIRRALIGSVASSVSSKQDVLAPLIYITTATPIRDSSGNIVGAAVVGLIMSNGFVDGIKQATGLDSAIYSGDTRSATTFVAADGHSRLIGIKETHKQVINQVLTRGQTFKGALNISNKPYLAVYDPLRDVDNTVVGMIFIGSPSFTLLKTAGRSVQLTFLVAIGLLLIAVWPAYAVARYIARQLE